MFMCKISYRNEMKLTTPSLITAISTIASPITMVDRADTLTIVAPKSPTWARYCIGWFKYRTKFVWCYRQISLVPRLSLLRRVRVGLYLPNFRSLKWTLTIQNPTRILLSLSTFHNLQSNRQTANSEPLVDKVTCVDHVQIGTNVCWLFIIWWGWRWGCHCTDHWATTSLYSALYVEPWILGFQFWPPPAFRFFSFFLPLSIKQSLSSWGKMCYST